MSEQSTIEAEKPLVMTVDTHVLENIIEYLCSRPCGETRILVNNLEYSIAMNNSQPQEPTKEE
jgi:hypothetical protein